MIFCMIHDELKKHLCFFFYLNEVKDVKINNETSKISNIVSSYHCKHFRFSIFHAVERLCTDLIKTQTIKTFLSCKLIALVINSGHSPIGVGKVLRKVAGKVIVSVLKNEVIDYIVSFQVYAGQELGIEAALHSLNSMCNNENNDAVLLVDASDAFNSLNRNLFLHNISYICAAISVFV